MIEGFSSGEGNQGVESNERYYRRRAVEERLAARRAMTDTARAWHAKLALDFAERASSCTSASACTSASSYSMASTSAAACTEIAVHG